MMQRATLNTYVIKDAVRAWKMKAIVVSSPPRYAPSRVQSARSPASKAQAPKKRAISANANMNLVMKK